MSLARARVRFIGRDRIHLCPEEGSPSGDLWTWLSCRPEVREARPPQSPAASQEDGARPRASLVVRYEEATGARGALRRSAKDMLYVRLSTEQSGFSVTVAHALPNRARLRVRGLSGNDLLRLAAWISGLFGVRSSVASPDTGSILVMLDNRPAGGADRGGEVRRVDATCLLSAIRESDRSMWPEAPPLASDKPDTGPVVYTSILLAVAAAEIAPAPLLIVGVGIASIPCARRTLAALRRGRLGVDLLDFVALVVALSTGLVTTAAFMVWLLAIGDTILDLASDKARAAISEVLSLDAVDAWRIVDGSPCRVPVSSLSAGDLIVIDAGARIAADGVVVEGVAMVDEKALTGEPLPTEKRAGASVLAATVVAEGQIIVRVERTGESTTAARIVRILEGTGNKAMSLQREIERRADWLVLPTIGVAGAAYALSGQLARLTACLITDFGTGVRIAIPTTILATMALAAREGVLVKGGHYLERLAKADTIVFDKTGTLTSGEPQIVRIVPLGRLTERAILALARGAEARQKHPIAEAICAHAEREGIDAVLAEVGSEVYTIGVGISARVGGRSVLLGGARMMALSQIRVPWEHPLLSARSVGSSVLFLAVDGAIEGAIVIADELRQESAEVVKKLSLDGRRELVLLSGDSPRAARAIGERLGIKQAFGGLLPEEKVQKVREMQAAGRVVAMVGDGINDAPALAIADVGISLDGATDVALEVADVVLLSGGLLRLPRAFEVADHAMKRVGTAVTIVIVPNVLAMVFGALGLIGPGVAAAVNNGSMVIAALSGVGPLIATRGKRGRRK